jgi:hypothetical protein
MGLKGSMYVTMEYFSNIKIVWNWVQEQVDLSKEWLRKYANPIDCINSRHSSYGFEHLVETREYISNGVFFKAAIEDGYSYILPAELRHDRSDVVWKYLSRFLKLEMYVFLTR